jgi:3-oxoadipate enol-lactonase
VTQAHANGIDLHYEITGSGPVVVFAHSLATDLSMWDAQAAALADRYTVLRFDSRGHGGSSAPAGDYSWELLCADVLGLLDSLGTARIHFVGLSMGGMLGQHLTLRAPERIASLTLACTTSRFPPGAGAVWPERIAAVRALGMQSQVEPTLARWFTGDYRDTHPDVIARIGAMIAATPPAGFIGSARAIATIDVTDRLGEISCPTLVIGGAEDPSTPPALQQIIAASIRGAQLEIIARAAHLANIEQADSFNRLLGEFLDGVTAKQITSDSKRIRVGG